ncbi:MAG: ribosome silencing factor [Proteobacteria bacterium]|nr:ribosome silencing factor [Pseudomonadota bacterium]
MNNAETKNNPTIGPAALNRLVQEVLEDHQAEDIVVIDLLGKSTIGDHMVIATGRSSRQVTALAETLVQALKANGLVGIKLEGARQGDWVLIDAGDVIIHLFRPENRGFYNLEKMWEADFSDHDQTTDPSHGPW